MTEEAKMTNEELAETIKTKIDAFQKAIENYQQAITLTESNLAHLRQCKGMYVDAVNNLNRAYLLKDPDRMEKVLMGANTLVKEMAIAHEKATGNQVLKKE